MGGGPGGPALDATYDVLGVGVRVVVGDEAAAGAVGHLLAGTPRAGGPPDRVLRLVPSGGGRPGRQDLLREEGPLAREMTPRLAVAMLLWHVNQLAASTRRYVVIHAGCVGLGGRGLVLPGPPEAGKSTLVTRLVLEGFDYLSDEYAALSFDGFLHPYPQPIALDQGSFPLFPGLEPQGMGGFRDPSRWHLRPEDLRPDARSEPVPPGAVVFLSYGPGQTCRLEPLRGSESLVLLAGHTVNLTLLGPPAFRLLGSLLRRVPGYRLAFSGLEEAAAVLRPLLLGDGERDSAGLEN